MNPNINTQIIHPFNFYIPPISSLQNPTSDDFERLIERYQQYFLFIINQDITQELQLKTISIKNHFQRFNLQIITCGKKLPE